MDEYEGEAGAGWRDGRFTVFEELDWQARDISALRGIQLTGLR